MRQIIFIIICLLFYQPNLLALEISQTVEKLQEKYNSTQDWQTNFVQTTYVDLLQKEINKNGNLFIKKPGKIRLEYKDKQGKQYISNGDKLWIYVPGDSQVIVYKKISKVVANEALIFLKGLGNLNQEFVIQLYPLENVKKAMINNQHLSFLELIPRKQDSIIEKIVLGVNRKTNTVEEITLFNHSGNTTHYSFNNIQFNSNIKDSLFEFETTEGIKEIKP